jgi:hypothetical protein
MLCLLATEISAVLVTIIPRCSTLLAVCRRRVVLLVVSIAIHFLLRLLCRNIWVVGCLAVTEGSSSYPARPVVWLVALTLSAASTETAM